MKKILIITPNCPYPPHKSGGIHALYNTIKENIKEKHNIDLLYYDEKDIEAEQEVSKYVNNVFYQDLRKENKFIVRLMSIANRKPYGVYQYDFKKIQLKQQYDKIIFDQLLSIDCVDVISAKENILMAYDSMPLYFFRKSKAEKESRFAREYNRLQTKFYERLQGVQFCKFDKIFYVSEYDSNYEKEKEPRFSEKIDYVNLGVNSDLFNNKKYNKPSEKSIIFTGIMNYAPNKDAVLYFVRNVFNRILEKHSDVKFYIVGKNPDNEIMELQSDNIVVTGFVDDIVKHISEAMVYVSPLKYGTGMKNKILEAMSTSKAIVASSVSVEGINELEHGENIYIADTDDEWCNYVDKLLNDEETRDKFGEKCRTIIESNYNWNKSFNKVIK